MNPQPRDAAGPAEPPYHEQDSPEAWHKQLGSSLFPTNSQLPTESLLLAPGTIIALPHLCSAPLPETQAAMKGAQGRLHPSSPYKSLQGDVKRLDRRSIVPAGSSLQPQEHLQSEGVTDRSWGCCMGEMPGWGSQQS